MKKLQYILFVVPVMVFFFTSCEKERLLVVNDDGGHYYVDEFEYINVPNSSIMVQSSNYGSSFTYDIAVLYCKALHVRGMYDWHLPTKAEILLIYNNTELLKSGVWWTSTESGDGYRFTFNADDGSFNSIGKYGRNSVIAVRSK